MMPVTIGVLARHYGKNGACIRAEHARAARARSRETNAA
jgi:hypothetical protein